MRFFRTLIMLATMCGLAAARTKPFFNASVVVEEPMLAMLSMFPGDIRADWPVTGTDECWARTAAGTSPCPLPRQEGVICLPDSPYGSDIAKGWAQDPRRISEPHDCRPGRHCIYACAAGYWPSYFDQDARAGYAYNVDTSPFGVKCTESGLELDRGPLCRRIDKDEMVAVAINNLDVPVWLCTTTYPGTEMPLIPQRLDPRSEMRMSVTPSWAWHGPDYAYAAPQIYTSMPGADLQHACAWNEATMDGVSHLPHQLMAIVYPPDSNPGVFADFSVFPNKFFVRPWGRVGYNVSVRCDPPGPTCFPTTIINADSTDYMQFVRVTTGPARVVFVFDPALPSWQPDPAKDFRFPSLPSTIESGTVALWGTW
jgi:hypothetical protein